MTTPASVVTVDGSPKDSPTTPLDQCDRRNGADQHIKNDAAGGRSDHRQYENADHVQSTLGGGDGP